MIVDLSTLRPKTKRQAAAISLASFVVVYSAFIALLFYVTNGSWWVLLALPVIWSADTLWGYVDRWVHDLVRE